MSQGACGNSSGRPVGRSFSEFVPLSREDREQSSFDLSVEPYKTCSYCQSLMGYVSHLCREPLDQAWYQSQGYKIQSHKRTISYQELEYSARQCHLCTLLLKTWRIRERTAQELANCTIATHLSTKYSTDVKSYQYLKFHIHFTISWDVSGSAGEESGKEEIYHSKTSRKDFSLRIDPQFPTRSKAICTGSRDCLELGKEWARICLHDHPDCAVSGPTWVPTRLIRITSLQQVQLVHKRDLGGPVSYYALSYCWGKDPVLTTTLSRLSEFSESIPFSELAYTVQDTIRVVFYLGGRYLWVDALCIIQDDLEDWTREAAAMCDVYRHSLLTVCALGSTGATKGLFGKRDALLGTPYLQQYGDEDWVLFPSWVGEDFHKGILHTRGWTFQERLLAPRKLFFGSTLFWECKSGLKSEWNHSGRPYTTKWPWIHLPDPEVAIGKLKPDPDAPGYYLMYSTVLSEWHQIMVRYSERLLTVPSDRIPAIQGIIVEFERRTGWSYVYGIVADHLPIDLIWSVRDNPRKPRKHQTPGCLGTVPSWSWGSIDGPISWPSMLLNYKPVQKTSIVIDKSNAKMIEVGGYLLRIRRDPAKSEWVLDDLPEKSVQRAQLDDIEHDLEEPHYFLPLFMGQYTIRPKIVHHVCHGLGLIQCASNALHYKRIGVFTISLGREDRTTEKIVRSEEPDWPEGRRYKFYLV